MPAGVAGFPVSVADAGQLRGVSSAKRATGLAGAPGRSGREDAALSSRPQSMLFLFSRCYTSESGAYGVIGFYLLLTVAGFIGEQYRIYFTNDYCDGGVLVWRAVYLIRAERLPAGGAADLRRGLGQGDDAARRSSCWPSRRSGPDARVALVVTMIAFAGAADCASHRCTRAPFVKWAWWDMVFANVPFPQRSIYEFSLTIKNNTIKVALFYTTCSWIWAAWRALTIEDRFARQPGARPGSRI